MIDHISTWWIGVDIAPKQRPRKPLSDITYPDLRLKRDRNRERGVCINENSRGTHGPATHGVRCRHCYEQHRKHR